MKILSNPIQHPGAIVRGAWSKEPAQELYLRRIWQWLKGKRELPLMDINSPPPNSKIFPTQEDLWEFTKQFVPEGDMDAVSIDIENAGPHIICVGCTAFSIESNVLGESVCTRFRRRGGSPWYSTRRELVEAVRWLYDLLDRSEIYMVFHNGVTHDVPILEDLGFSVQGKLLDTMGLQHTCYPEMSKGLQYCATLYNWAPVWKTLVDLEDEEDGKG